MIAEDNIMQVKDLITYCDKCPALFNETANRLDRLFNIKSVELVLLVTYFINEERKRNEN